MDRKLDLCQGSDLNRRPLGYELSHILVSSHNLDVTMLHIAAEVSTRCNPGATNELPPRSIDTLGDPRYTRYPQDRDSRGLLAPTAGSGPDVPWGVRVGYRPTGTRLRRSRAHYPGRPRTPLPPLPPLCLHERETVTFGWGYCVVHAIPCVSRTFATSAKDVAIAIAFASVEP